jgi:hypothetical protein
MSVLLFEGGAVQVAGVGAPLGLLAPGIWWPQGHFDRFVIFSEFIISLSMFRHRLLQARPCVSP